MSDKTTESTNTGESSVEPAAEAEVEPTATGTDETTGKEVTYRPDERYIVVLPKLVFYLPDPTGSEDVRGVIVTRGDHPPTGVDPDTLTICQLSGSIAFAGDGLLHGRRLG